VKWRFGKKRPSDKTRDPVVSEFFASEAIKDAGEALVREAIQNSLDARRDDADVVSVRVYVSGGQTSLRLTQASPWFDGAWPHYLAVGNGLRPGDVTQDGPCRYLVFEDFGTTGLIGDRAQYEERNGQDNPFFYFFRAEAKTAKHGDSRGRWGIGKQVFPRASRAQTFFGYTEVEDGGFLMGGTILKHHWVGDVCFKPDGFWGDTVSIGEDTLTVPTSDPELLAAFRGDFRLRRTPGQRGLSVVVPWLDSAGDEGPSADGFRRDDLAFAILSAYFLPVIEGRLEASVEDESGTYNISQATYRLIVDQLRATPDPSRRLEAERLEGLIRIAEVARSRSYLTFDLQPCPAAKAAWTDDMLDDASASQLREALGSGQTVCITATVPVRPKSGAEATDNFQCFLQKDERSLGRPCHVREDLIISDVKSGKVPGYASLVRVDKGPLATLLGDSENPAHTEWQAAARNFKDKYIYGGLAIDFVSKFPAEVLKRVHASSRELDRTLLLDLFADEGPEQAGPVKRKVKRPIDRPIPPVVPPSQPSRYRIEQTASGFTVRCPAGRLPVGTTLVVRAAYETSKGNPFKAYNSNDFDFSVAPMVVTVDGAEEVTRSANELHVRMLDTDAEIRVEGFDVNRDVQARVAVSPASQTDVEESVVDAEQES
jgi:hypothetical protein